MDSYTSVAKEILSTISFDEEGKPVCDQSSLSRIDPKKIKNFQIYLNKKIVSKQKLNVLLDCPLSCQDSKGRYHKVKWGSAKNCRNFQKMSLSQRRKVLKNFPNILRCCLVEENTRFSHPRKQAHRCIETHCKYCKKWGHSYLICRNPAAPHNKPNPKPLRLLHIDPEESFQEYDELKDTEDDEDQEDDDDQGSEDDHKVVKQAIRSLRIQIS